MKIRNFVIAAALFLPGAAGFASTIVQTQGAGLNGVGNSFAVPVQFNQFDPALGTLVSTDSVIF